MARNRLGHLVGLTGFAGSGKDTAAAGLVAAGWTRQAFADPVRAMALAIDPWIFMGARNLRLSFLVGNFGWDEMKRHADVRQFLQRLGTDAVRAHLGEDAWVRAFDRARNRSVDTVATDVRFPNEALHIRRHGGIVIRIDRPGVGPVNGHASENIGAFEVDATVVNDGTPEELQARVVGIVEAHYRERVPLPF